MAAVPERAGVVRDAATGELIIPASQRPDGTWRKARRVKDGYIPQEEVPTYETKGTQWNKSRPDYPIGLWKEDVDKMKKVKEAQIEASTNAAVRAKNAKQKENIPQKGSSKSVNSVAKGIAKVDLSSEGKSSGEQPREELVKRARILRKKVREIEQLESKIKSGELKEPQKEQLEKIEKKQSCLDQLKEIESKMTA